MSTKISWTDETINPVVGCSKISAGCQNCYAATAAKSARLQQFPQYQAVKDWDGTVSFVEAQLKKPLQWGTPKRIFCCSMSDLFHANVPDEWIDKVLGMAAACPQHTFQILTKRPERMLYYMSSQTRKQRVLDQIPSHLQLNLSFPKGTWPLHNVWFGVSVENQKAAKERIPVLLRTPAAVRFLSCEPLLEPVHLFEWLGSCLGQGICDACEEEGIVYSVDSSPFAGGAICTNCSPRIDWVIVGGESGKKARECHVDWIVSLVNQSKTAKVPVFVKQLGNNVVVSDSYVEDFKQLGIIAFNPSANKTYSLKLTGNKAEDILEWPEYLRVREFPCRKCTTKLDSF